MEINGSGQSQDSMIRRSSDMRVSGRDEFRNGWPSAY